MAYAVKTNAAAQKAVAETSGGYEALPPGKYEANVIEYEVRPASQPGGVNADLDVLNVKVKIVEGSTVGAGRTFYSNVPLFHKWNPSGKPGAKFPDGAPAYDHFGFFGDAIGQTDEQLAEGIIPEFAALLGRRVGIKLKTEDSRTKKAADGVSPLKVSVIDSWHKATGATGPAVNASVAAAAGDPWATSAPTAAPAAPAADPWATTAAPTVPAEAWNSPAAVAADVVAVQQQTTPTLVGAGAGQGF